jgi:hypothetical protein
LRTHIPPRPPTWAQDLRGPRGDAPCSPSVTGVGPARLPLRPAGGVIWVCDRTVRLGVTMQEMIGRASGVALAPPRPPTWAQDLRGPRGDAPCSPSVTGVGPARLPLRPAGGVIWVSDRTVRLGVTMQEMIGRASGVALASKLLIRCQEAPIPPQCLDFLFQCIPMLPVRIHRLDQCDLALHRSGRGLVLWVAVAKKAQDPCCH